jgi:hypothetical protein
LFTEIEPGELTDDESDSEDKVSQERLSLLGNITWSNSVKEHPKVSKISG